MSFPEKIKVGEIFVAAGAAFGKMAEMIESIQKAGETSTTGKWSVQEIRMLQSALKPFIAELRRIHSTVQNKKDEEKSAVSDPTDFIDMNEPSTVKAADDREMAFNKSLSELPKSEVIPFSQPIGTLTANHYLCLLKDMIHDGYQDLMCGSNMMGLLWIKISVSSYHIHPTNSWIWWPMSRAP
ncbi:hypothetical protein CEXT_507921, partial [Caerostris extrusa]